MKRALSQILNENFGLSEEDYLLAQEAASEKGERVGETLIKKKLLTETQLLEALSLMYDMPFWPDLPLDDVDTDFTRKVPIQFLKKYVIVPLQFRNRNLARTGANAPGSPRAPEDASTAACVLATNDPAGLQPMDDLLRVMGTQDCQMVLSKRDTIVNAINLFYNASRNSAQQLVEDLEANGSQILSEIQGTADLLDDTSDAPIIKLVNHIISQSIKARASDIHIEPFQNTFKVRYRIDGILYDLLTPPKWIQSALVSRIKVMADMNIAEKRLPQDGRFEVKIGNQNIDIRVSTIPTSFGERVVLRLLNKSGSLLNISDIGLSPEKLRIIKNLIRSPNGIILVTGPTGSGKTTTLYAILSTLNTPDVNIITIEDPVEYQINGIGQIQVNPKINLTFAQGLRSIVRQDPDIILVGEIRDKDTSEIAVQSALTGHLVFSTLHTNDSASAITRLVDIGIEPFLISSSVLGVVAQRLIRILCEHCREPYTPDPAALESIGLTPDQINGSMVYQAKGCNHCFNTGYKGRIGIFEIMLLDDELKRLILKTYDSNIIKSEAVKQHMTTLRQDGIEKVLSGVTTIEEVLRITQK
ncbi:MAG: type II secretion system ATPase GspE [Desulfobacterales bacterium]|nr:type II secretion system ATPase GspE [Desulfobacterales bacterium]